MKYEIYVKGCGDSSNNAATCALVLKCNGEYLHKTAIRFEEYIGRGTDYPVIDNKAQFQMELYAIAWAMSFVADKSASFKVYTNNLAVAGWIKKWDVPDDYRNLFRACRLLLNGRKIDAEHIRKDSDIEENKQVNDAANYLLKMSGNQVRYVF